MTAKPKGHKWTFFVAMVSLTLQPPRSPGLRTLGNCDR